METILEKVSKRQKTKKFLIHKDICPEYMTLEHHANGWKTVMMANAQHSQKSTETFTAHAPSKSIANNSIILNIKSLG